MLFSESIDHTLLGYGVAFALACSNVWLRLVTKEYDTTWQFLSKNKFVYLASVFFGTIAIVYLFLIQHGIVPAIWDAAETQAPWQSTYLSAVLCGTLARSLTTHVFGQTKLGGKDIELSLKLIFWNLPDWLDTQTRLTHHFLRRAYLEPFISNLRNVKIEDLVQHLIAQAPWEQEALKNEFDEWSVNDKLTLGRCLGRYLELYGKKNLELALKDMS